MVVCFIGHRKIQNKLAIKSKLKKVLLSLIERGADCFLFGSKSEFNLICWEEVSKLKNQYKHLKRIYVRSSYSNISTQYKAYLLQFYEETYLPQRIVNAGKCSYVERNFEMVDKSDVCVFYFDENYSPPLKFSKSSFPVDCKATSGTKIAYNYALSKNKQIINLYSCIN